jgi:hypothetical protein
MPAIRILADGRLRWAARVVENHLLVCAKFNASRMTVGVHLHLEHQVVTSRLLVVKYKTLATDVGI